MLNSADISEVPMPNTVLADAIIPNPVIVTPDTDLMDVIMAMSQAQYSQCQLGAEGSASSPSGTSESCVLVAQDGRLQGIYTERDLVSLVAQGISPRGVTVAAVMTSPVITQSIEGLTDVFSTLQFMQQRHIRHLPIVDRQGKIVGLVTPQSLRELLKLMDLLRLRQVEEVMQPQVVQAERQTSILQIAQQMTDCHVSCVVIVETSATGITKPVGVVTERDIVQFQCLDLDFANLRADMVMSTPLQCLRPQDTLWAAHRLMQAKRIRRLVIVDDQGQLAGVVTQTSMLNIFGTSEIHETLEMLQQRIKDLEDEKLDLLAGRNLILERQVAERTAELQNRANREQFLATFARQVSQSFDFQAMLNSAVQEVQQFLGCDRVVVYQFQNDLQGIVIAEAVEPQWNSTLGSQYQDVCFPKWLEADYLDGRQRIVDDIYRANLQDCHIEFLESLQVKGYLIVPIVISDRLWGLLAAHHCDRAQPWAEHNLDLIDRLSIQLAIAIQQGQLYQQAQVEIQERQQAERNLQQERNFANAIVNAAGALVVVSDAQGRIVQFNQTCQRITGYSLAEVQGRQVWEFLIPPAEREQIQRLIQSVLAQDSQGTSENYWLTKTGDRRLIAWTNSTLLDVHGQVEYMIGTGIDVTEARQAEAALRKSEATNRALLDTIPDLMIRMRRDGTYLDFLPARDFHVTQPFAQMVGHTIFEIMPAAIAQERMHYVEQAFITGQTQVYEYEYAAESGQQLYEEARVAISGDQEVLVIIRDISERKHLEIARQKAEVALHHVVAGTAAVTGEHFMEALVEHLAIALDVRQTQIAVLVGDALQTLGLYTDGQLQPNVAYELCGLPCEVTLQQQLYCCPQDLQQHFSAECLAGLAAESYFGIALHNLEGQAIGTLCLFDDKPIQDEALVENILKIFAARAAAELERQHSIDALEQLNQELESRVAARTKELSAMNMALLDSNAALLNIQTELHRSEELLRLTIDNAPIGIVTLDLDGHFLMVNQAFQLMLGYTATELIAQSVDRLTHPDDRAASQAAMAQLMAGEVDTLQLEKRYLHKDGTVVDTIVRLGTVRDLNGQPLHFVKEIEDIRDRKRAEAERTRLLNILEASLNEIYIFDADTLKFNYVNQSALQNLGYSLAELQQMTPVDIKPELSITDFEILITPLRQGEVTNLNFETKHQRADGSLYPVDIQLQFMERADERIFLAIILDITEREHAAEQINRQLVAMETAVEGIAILRNGIYQYLNQAHIDLFGYEHADDLLGQSWQALYSEAEQQRFERDVFPVLAREGYWCGEATAIRKDGSSFYEEVSLTLSSHSDLICVCRDITERKQAEVKLRESQELLQDFFDSASDLIQSVSMIDGRFLFVNQSWLDTMGYSASEVKTLSIFDVLSPASQQHCQQFFQQMQQGNCAELNNVSLDLVTQSGNIIQIEGSVNVRCENGMPVATRGIFRNVTERRRAELAMKRQLAAIEAASDGIAVLDSQYRYVFVNTAHCRLFGLQHPEDLLGQTWQKLYAPLEAERLQQEVLPQLLEQQHWRGEAIATRQDGSTFPQEISLTRIQGVGLVCVCQDISDRKRVEAEIRRTLETERELNELKSRFVSITSHEFRTPLGIIASSAGILQDYGDRLDRPKQEKHLTRIQSSVDHMTQLLEDVLILSKVEAGKLNLQLVPTQLEDFCRDIIEELDFSHEQSRIQLQLGSSPPLRRVLVDLRIMRQILTNLLSNALKYSFPDSEVYLTIEQDQQHTNFIIQDQGIGIPAEDLNRLFQSFHRANNVGDIPGTGLGLSIVKRLVELHQGRITCQSTVNVGTTFLVQLQLAGDNAADQSWPDPASALGADLNPSSKLDSDLN